MTDAMPDASGVIDSGIFAPFEITLKVSATEQRLYECRQLVHLIPGRRLSAYAWQGDKKLFIKVYLQRRRALADYEAEVNGYQLLHHGSYDIPARLYHGPAEGGINIVVYQVIQRARSLQTVFAEKPDLQGDHRILDQLIQLFEHLHRDRLIHQEPGLGDFMVKADDIYVVNASAVRQVGNEHLLDRNMAMMIAAFPRSWHVASYWIERWLQRTQRQQDQEYRQLLEQLIQKQQLSHELAVLRLIYREGAQFHVRSTIFGKMIFARDYLRTGLLEYLSEPQSLFEGDHVEVIHESRDATVARVEIAGVDYIVKRFNHHHWRRRVSNVMQKSAASRCWLNAHRLNIRGLRTAKPVALVECLKGRLKGISVYVSEAVPGVTVGDFFQQPHIINPVKQEVADNITATIDELHDESLLHGQLSSDNIIIHQGQAVLIDLDRMTQCRSRLCLRRGRRKDRQILNESLDEQARQFLLF